MKLFKTTFSLILALLLIFSVASTSVSAATITTTPTGYTKASDVVYNITSGTIANWGARGETSIFLTTYATSYYSGDNSFDSLSQKDGGTSQNNAHQSELYGELAELMASSHKFYTYYSGNKNVRDFYKYTDCMNSDTSKVALIYNSQIESSAWNSGNIWNQEHVWPQSKLNSDKQIGDIMHLRPCNPSQNSGRGNTPFGESAKFYDPGESVHGDCARTVLYMYVRWGTTSAMWGSNGVIESLDVLLRWMQEDPVDTWEMGRNDAVQSITGTRNVFVDYPEFAWLLFGEDIPKNMTTPSGKAKQSGTGSGTTSSSDSTSSDTTSNSSSGNSTTSSTTSGSSGVCSHANVSLKYVAPATCEIEGYSGDVVCNDCGHTVTKGQSTKKTAHISKDGNYTCDVCGAKMSCIHKNSVTENNKDATCIRNGYSGDEVCTDCKAIIREGLIVPQTGVHAFGEWHVPSSADNENAPKQRICAECGLIEREQEKTVSEPVEKENSSVIIFIIIGALSSIIIAVVVIVIISKKKNH